jgi:ketosteroid isomerase-like protein
MTQDVATRREATKAAFLKLLGHLGRKEFDAFEACLAPDFVQEWPYLPLPTLPHRMEGAATARRAMETGMSDFDGYNYRVIALHDQLDPEFLIAEYSSHSHYRRRNVPYSNRYISLLRFRDGKLVHWVEYVNPLIIKEALLDDFDISLEQRASRPEDRA